MHHTVPFVFFVKLKDNLFCIIVLEVNNDFYRNWKLISSHHTHIILTRNSSLSFCFSKNLYIISYAIEYYSIITLNVKVFREGSKRRIRVRWDRKETVARSNQSYKWASARPGTRAAQRGVAEALVPPLRVLTSAARCSAATTPTVVQGRCARRRHSHSKGPTSCSPASPARCCSLNQGDNNLSTRGMDPHH